MHSHKDIAAGNVDLKQVEKELLQKMSLKGREAQVQQTKQSQGTAMRQPLRRERLESLQEWKERLCENIAIKAMLQVCTRFKKVSDTITTWKGSEQEWKTLAQILQGEAEDRRRILYFRSVAVGWMEAKDVDVLSQAREHQPIYSTRDCDGKILCRRECPSSRPISYGTNNCRAIKKVKGMKCHPKSHRHYLQMKPHLNRQSR